MHEQMQAHLHAADPGGYDDIPSHGFQDGTDAADAVELWKHIYSVHIEAERCHNHRKDESAWVEVVRSILKLADFGQHDGKFEINSM